MDERLTLHVPTSEEIERFIDAAKLQLGPDSKKDFVLWCAIAIREARLSRRWFTVTDDGQSVACRFMNQPHFGTGGDGSHSSPTTAHGGPGMGGGVVQVVQTSP